MSSHPLAEERLDPRIKRTRALLGQAFEAALHDKGFQAVSIQDITDRAGVNRTTFYLHFPDKYALLDYHISQEFRQELEEHRLDTSRFSADSLRRLLVMVAEFAAGSNRSCPRHEAQFEGLVETQVKKHLQGLLEQWLELAGPAAELRVDPTTAAAAASWAIYGLALQWTHQRKRTSAEAFADKTFPVVAAIVGLAEPA
jgi:AcrR family transcriptional regulator